MSRFTRCQLKAILRKGVEAMAMTEKFCDRFNGFLVLNHRSDLNATAPDKESEDYFCRDENLRYPILTIYESEPDQEYFGKCKEEKVRYEIGVLDQLVEDCGDCNECDGRKEEQLYKDTHKLLKWLVAYIQTITAYTNGAGECIWQSNLFPIPAGYTANLPMTRRFQTPFRRDNKTSKGNRWRGVADNLYGTFRIFYFCFWDCEEPEVNLELDTLDEKDCC